MKKGSMGRWISVSFFLLALLKAADAETGRLGINKTAELPSIAGRFEWSVAFTGEPTHRERREWFMWRQPARVETRDGAGETGEVWRRANNGEVAYQRVFHREKRIIEYTEGDLRALDRSPDWRSVAHLIAPSFLKDRLNEGERLEILGRPARRYTGMVDGVALEVLWLEEEQIPAQVREIFKDQERLLLLKEIYPLNRSPWPYGQTADYEPTDYADIGDQEADPFLQYLLNAERPTHRH